MVLALVAAVAVISVVATATSHDKASYQYGYDTISPLAKQLGDSGMRSDATYLCGQAYGIGTLSGRLAPDYVKDDVIAGCVDRLKNG